MYAIEFTRKYLKDLKLARKRNLDESKLNEVISILSKGEALPVKNKDHSLSGDYSGSESVILHLIGFLFIQSIMD